jgi:hypothetical protein
MRTQYAGRGGRLHFTQLGLVQCILLIGEVAGLGERFKTLLEIFWPPHPVSRNLNI